MTPLAVDPSHPFPYISGLSLNLAVVVLNEATDKTYFARVKVPQSLPRLVNVESVMPDFEGVATEDLAATKAGTNFVPLEEVIAAHLDTLFPGMKVLESHTFRVTRNEDLEVEEDDAENLLTAMEQELLRRRFGPVVRLEVAEDISQTVLDFLIDRLEISEQDVLRLPEPLDLTALNDLHDLDLPHLKYPKYVPVTPRGVGGV